jgi:5-methyltetrahydrofolate--homocysteine methyltransferase
MSAETFDFPAMARALILGDRDTVARKTREGLDAGMDPKELIFKGLIPGMDVVGEKFRRNEYYVPQVLLSARAMYAGLDLLKPLITASAKGDDYLGVVVIGTAQGDLHDIGKNLVAMMLEGAGFKVVNLGRDVAPEKFVEAVTEHRANIVGISALMTTTMPAMKRTIDALVKAGLREHVKVMIGGAPVSQAFADEIGADGYAKDSTLAVVKAKILMRVEEATEAVR